MRLAWKCIRAATTNDERSTGRALIFDLDGVVIDSMPKHTEASRVYLEGLGIECEGIEPRMHGRRNDEIVADFIGPSLTAEAIFAQGAAREQLYRDLMKPQPHEPTSFRASLSFFDPAPDRRSGWRRMPSRRISISCSMARDCGNGSRLLSMATG